MPDNVSRNSREKPVCVGEKVVGAKKMMIDSFELDYEDVVTGTSYFTQRIGSRNFGMDGRRNKKR